MRAGQSTDGPTEQEVQLEDLRGLDSVFKLEVTGVLQSTHPKQVDGVDQIHPKNDEGCRCCWAWYTITSLFLG